MITNDMEIIEIKDAPLTEIEKKGIRNGIANLEDAILARPGTVYGDQPDMPLKHSFGENLYVREIFAPKGKIIVTKLHKKAHPFFLLKGVVSVLTDEGPRLIEAPYYGITPAGTKRAIYIHEDTVWVTVHATEEKDLIKIEEDIIAKDYDECLPTEAQATQIEGGK